MIISLYYGNIVHQVPILPNEIIYCNWGKLSLVIVLLKRSSQSLLFPWRDGKQIGNKWENWLMIKASAVPTMTEIWDGTDCRSSSHLLHFGGPGYHSESSEENALMFKRRQLKIQTPPSALQPGLTTACTCLYSNKALWIIIRPTDCCKG